MAAELLVEYARQQRRQRRLEEARSYFIGIVLPIGASIALGYVAAGVF